jgi:hypothetical protein
VSALRFRRTMTRPPPTAIVKTMRARNNIFLSLMGSSYLVNRRIWFCNAANAGPTSAAV